MIVSTRFLLIIGVVVLVGCSDYDRATRAYAAGRYAEAAQLFTEMANAGDARAQFDLSHMKFAGIGGDRDEAAGWSLLVSAANGGNLDAMAEVGMRYASGLGAGQNLILAARWYRRAGHQGHGIAAFNLASMYEAGTEIPKDMLRAYAWYVIADKNGNGAAHARINELRSKMKAGDAERADKLVVKLLEDPES